MTPTGARRTARRSLGAVLAALLLLLAGCSDAPTEEEIERADDGIDPSIVAIFVSEPLLPVIEELGNVFLIQHNGTTFQYIAKPSDDLAARVANGFRPALWIDDRETIAPFADDGDVYGAPTPVGDDVMQFIVVRDYDGPPLTLEVFGPGAEPAASGLCDPEPPCGVAARDILEQAGVEPEPDVTSADPAALLPAMRAGEFQTSLLYRSQVARLYTIFDVLTLPDPTIGAFTYESISMQDLPVAAEFQDWIATSPSAAEILTKRGLRDREATVAR